MPKTTLLERITVKVLEISMICPVATIELSAYVSAITVEFHIRILSVFTHVDDEQTD